MIRMKGDEHMEFLQLDETSKTKEIEEFLNNFFRAPEEVGYTLNSSLENNYQDTLESFWVKYNDEETTFPPNVLLITDGNELMIIEVQGSRFKQIKKIY